MECGGRVAMDAVRKRVAQRFEKLLEERLPVKGEYSIINIIKTEINHAGSDEALVSDRTG
jgi:hypothetical protein